MESRQPNNEFTVSGSEFDSAHDDANSPVVMIEMTAEIRQVIAASVGGGDGENISAPSISKKAS